MKYLDLNRLWSYMISALIAFLEPISVLILWLLIFILVDMVTGIYASIIERKLITSHKLQRTVIKFLMYSTTVILLHGLNVYMLTFAECALAKIGATIICGIEIYSVFENCYRATKNPVFKVLTQFTLGKIEEKTGVHIEENEK